MTYSNKPLVINSKYIVFIAMLYTTVMLAADVVAFRFQNVYGLVASGATIIFPFTYILGDVICEVYGWKTTMRIVWLSLLCEGLFAIIITIVINMPTYGIGEYQDQYVNVLGNIWLFVLGGIVSNLVSGFLNIYCMSKSKIFADGQYFWLRSIAATCISEFVLIMITVLIAFLPLMNFAITMKVFQHAYILEVFYSCVFVIPAKILVDYLRNKEKIDAYDYGVSYNPFKIFTDGDQGENRYSRSDARGSLIN